MSHDLLVQMAYLFFLSTIWWLDTLKRIGKIMREDAFQQKKKKPDENLTPG